MERKLSSKRKQLGSSYKHRAQVRSSRLGNGFLGTCRGQLTCGRLWHRLVASSAPCLALGQA
eukprot:3983647-Amphidinium_carterae.1